MDFEVYILDFFFYIQIFLYLSISLHTTPLAHVSWKRNTFPQGRNEIQDADAPRPALAADFLIMRLKCCTFTIKNWVQG